MENSWKASCKAYKDELIHKTYIYFLSTRIYIRNCKIINDQWASASFDSRTSRCKIYLFDTRILFPYDFPLGFHNKLLCKLLSIVVSRFFSMEWGCSMKDDRAVDSASIVLNIFSLAELTMGMWDLNLIGFSSTYLLLVS